MGNNRKQFFISTVINFKPITFFFWSSQAYNVNCNNWSLSTRGWPTFYAHIYFRKIKIVSKLSPLHCNLLTSVCYIFCDIIRALILRVMPGCINLVVKSAITVVHWIPYLFSYKYWFMLSRDLYHVVVDHKHEVNVGTITNDMLILPWWLDF